MKENYQTPCSSYTILHEMKKLETMTRKFSWTDLRKEILSHDFGCDFTFTDEEIQLGFGQGKPQVKRDATEYFKHKK